VIRRQAISLLAVGPASSLGEAVHQSSAPAHALARFLFAALLPRGEVELAFQVGLRAMRLTGDGREVVTGERRSGGGGASAASASAAHQRWHALTHIEGQQCALASLMMGAAKGETSKGFRQSSANCGRCSAN